MTEHPRPSGVFIARLVMAAATVLAAWIGFAYVLGDPARTATPSFEAAKAIGPMPAWGLLFLAGALACATTAALDNRRLMADALFIGGAIYTWWATLFAVSAIIVPTASLVAPGTYLFVATIHFLCFYWLRTAGASR